MSDIAGIAPRRASRVGRAVGAERLERTRAPLALRTRTEPGEHGVDLADVIAREQVDGGERIFPARHA